MPDHRGPGHAGAPALLCPVRGCQLPLTPEQRRWVCPEGHAFDTSRSGYLNLLQPQDRRSRHPGDSAEAVAARRRLHHLGITRPLLHAIAEMAAVTGQDVVLDAGCGDGFYTGSLHEGSGCDAYGIDISVSAIDAAAKRFRNCFWIVGNADRLIPFADASFTVLLSITARMNVRQFHRVLQANGRLLIALPAPDDLIELRGSGRDRVERTLRDFGTHFEVMDQKRVTTTAELDVPGVKDVLFSIYRPLRARPPEALRVTFSLDLLLFRPLIIEPSTKSP